jgi:hypothetical protein
MVLLGSGFAFAAGLPGVPKAFQPYAKWQRVNAKPIPPTPTTAHSGDPKNVYASKRKVGKRFPYGTIIVKEGLTGTGSKRFVSLIATMQKRRGADPRHGDWVFVEWARSRAGERFTLLARDGVCWSCHVQARPTDWVFTQR